MLCISEKNQLRHVLWQSSKIKYRKLRYILEYIIYRLDVADSVGYNVCTTY